MKSVTLRSSKLTGMMLVGIALLATSSALGRRVGTIEPAVSSPSSSNSPDEAAIRALYQQKIEGWNKRSGAGFAAAFTDDADLVRFGTHLKGRQKIAAFHQQLFDKFSNGSHFEGQIKSIRFLSSDVALIHAVTRAVITRHSAALEGRDSIETLVLTKSDGKWRIATLQNSRLALEQEIAALP